MSDEMLWLVGGSVVCFIYPLLIQTKFDRKYGSTALEYTPVIMNIVAFLVVFSAIYFGYDAYSVFAAVFASIIYSISTIWVWKEACASQCTIGDRVHKVLANALLPLGIAGLILLAMLFLCVLLTSGGGKGDKKKK